MKMVIRSIFVLATLTGCGSCENDVALSPKVYPAEFTFGYYGAFIRNPDLLVMVKQDSFFTTHRQPYVDLKRPAWYPLKISDSLKVAFLNFSTTIPTQLWSEPDGPIGVPMADGSKFYISITANGPNEGLVHSIRIPGLP